MREADRAAIARYVDRHVDHQHARTYRNSAPTLYGSTFETAADWIARAAIAITIALLVLAIVRRLAA